METQISCCTCTCICICTTWKGFAEPPNANALSRKGCPSCRCLRPEASAPGLYRFPLSTSIYSILLSPLLQYPICSYNVLHCSIMYYSNTSTMWLLASAQCATCFSAMCFDGVLGASAQCASAVWRLSKMAIDKCCKAAWTVLYLFITQTVTLVKKMRYISLWPLSSGSHSLCSNQSVRSFLHISVVSGEMNYLSSAKDSQY